MHREKKSSQGQRLLHSKYLKTKYTFIFERLLLLLSIYVVLTSIRIYNENLYSSSFKPIQVSKTKKCTKN